MAGAAGAGAAGASAGVAMAGGNPFQLATNLYAEKNNVGIITSQVLTAAQFPSGGQINAGQYLRGLRLILRTVTAGTGAVTLGATISDFPWNIFTQTDLVNVDGSEILYVMGGYAHYLAQKYGRPWLGDPALYADAANATATIPQCTLFLQPEIRWTAGCLANTDTRSQYRYDAVLDTIANVVQGGSAWATTAPTVSVTPYMDAWAQPDGADLQGTPNQPVPPGLNLQFKRRHQIYTLNTGGSDNIMQSALTGNALRNQIIVSRTSAAGSNRIEAFTDPLLWQIDNRSLGKISINRPSAAIGSPGGDLIGLWDSEQYNEYFFATQVQGTITAGLTPTTGFAREVGVLVFPRFLKPGSLYGQGWLYTANSTKEIFESTSASGLPASSTAELISDELYPVGPVDPQLTDI
jgi:hypothetical protein